MSVGLMSIRRLVLDPILVRAAEEAGAEVQMAATVTGLVEEAGRVVGVRVVRGASEAVLRARLVVGADGRNSTVAPSDVLTPPRLLAATGRLLARQGGDRRRILRELATLLTQDRHRRLVNRRPAYAPHAATPEAWPTGVDEATT
jgi:phytoene dehydrogenase-like protein